MQISNHRLSPIRAADQVSKCFIGTVIHAKTGVYMFQNNMVERGGVGGVIRKLSAGENGNVKE